MKNLTTEQKFASKMTRFCFGTMFALWVFLKIVYINNAHQTTFFGANQWAIVITRGMLFTCLWLLSPVILILTPNGLVIGWTPEVWTLLDYWFYWLPGRKGAVVLFRGLCDQRSETAPQALGRCSAVRSGDGHRVDRWAERSAVVGDPNWNGQEFRSCTRHLFCGW